MSEAGKNSDNEPSSGKGTSGNSEKSWMIQLGRYSQIGFALPAATVIGWFVGKSLDHRLHTSWLHLAGLLVGIVAGFIELIRVASKPETGGGAS